MSIVVFCVTGHVQCQWVKDMGTARQDAQRDKCGGAELAK